MNIKKILTIVITASLLVVGVAAVSAQGPREGRGQLGEHRAEMQALVEEYTGLTHDEIRVALQDGSTLADLIEAHGQSVDDFIAASVEFAEASLEEAVEAGFLTEEKATEKAAELMENITARVNGEFERPSFDDRQRPEFGDGQHPNFGNSQRPGSGGQGKGNPSPNADT